MPLTTFVVDTDTMLFGQITHYYKKHTFFFFPPEIKSQPYFSSMHMYLYQEHCYFTPAMSHRLLETHPSLWKQNAKLHELPAAFRHRFCF